MTAVPPAERGTALLSVLLLVAVMATVSATLLDRLGLATRLAANARDTAQARAWLTSAELLAMTRIEDLKAASPGRLTSAGDWQGKTRRIALPDATSVLATIRDGGNCFNLNALGRKLDEVVLAGRPEGVIEFQSLMEAIGIERGRALRIASASADYIDDDDVALPDGVERGGYPAGAQPANRPMVDPSELRAVPGVGAAEFARLAPWVCALPEIGRSPVNLNTLTPDQAPLLVMLSQGKLSATAARSLIAARPPAGFSTTDVVPEGDGREQMALDTHFFRLEGRIEGPSAGSGQALRALIDARQRPARVIARQWGDWE